MDILWALLSTTRPRQWLKNSALAASLVFSGLLYAPGAFLTVVWAMFIFTLLSSSIYVFNDLLDIDADKKHPFKKKRPLPSGRLPIPVAVLYVIFGVITGLTLAYELNFFFFAVCFSYLMLSGVLYTFWFKRITIVDVLTIASGYILRVYAGAVAIDAHMNVWFLITVISLSLFLAVGKRRSEMTLLAGVGNKGEVRKTLKHYTESLLDIYTAMFANSTWFGYALFAFNHPKIVPEGRWLSLLSVLPRTFVSEKWMMATIPFVVYGVMRYLQLVYEKNEGESPERVILSDKPLITTVLVWGLAVTVLLYGF
ncbi:hypothetical protein A2368_03325 [Candidatus Collierbacteria bacterium RIFOXYB1_FULL_49_13]|uniref:Phosphoribose diphosphate--decaprenyl-phosphate phosphoribosyltransferase n=1 Tax=Candidatus Collierbacteria bacterium RIFOXYB1_FULL_49_13 TaxID=1817728 RepID=A0A1F5FGQ3_9BACT|nr:MAG: hypothetical protein A2368_03325 [Candidatus Collierbacteria bacterium RIFOXYB1_FULL_49_13]